MSPLRICITGPDGAGKSTLIAGLIEALEARHGAGSAVHVQVWDALQGLLDRAAAQRYLAVVDHRSRALLLLHAVSRALALGESSGARVVLLDGYWFKYAVSELEHGAPEALFAGCAEGFPAPDRVFALDLDPEEALRRKAELTDYERGFGDDPEAFLAFQRRLRARWEALETAVGPWTHLSALQSPDVLRDRVLSEIEVLLEGRP